jgi:hypothetical protein
MKERVKVLGKKFGRLTPIKRIDRKDKHRCIQGRICHGSQDKEMGQSLRGE